MTDSIIVQQPPGAPAQLVLLFHGVGALASDLLPLARQLTAAFPQAFVVSVAAPEACDLGRGRQWFSVQGVDENNRVTRVAEALPAFSNAIRHWQAVSGVAADATALIGFSQGAIMALAATDATPPPAARVVAIAGRFVAPPVMAPAGCTVHLIHGKEDSVIHYRNTVDAAERLIALGGDVTADVLPFTGHAITQEVAQLVVERLKGYLPKRVWDEALRAAPAAAELARHSAG